MPWASQGTSIPESVLCGMWVKLVPFLPAGLRGSSSTSSSVVSVFSLFNPHGRRRAETGSEEQPVPAECNWF